jgi:hypothetical protein
MCFGEMTLYASKESSAFNSKGKMLLLGCLTLEDEVAALVWQPFIQSTMSHSISSASSRFVLTECLSVGRLSIISRVLPPFAGNFHIAVVVYQITSSLCRGYFLNEVLYFRFLIFARHTTRTNNAYSSGT